MDIDIINVNAEGMTPLEYKLGLALVEASMYEGELDVVQIRESCGMTVKEFAANFGIQLATLHSWERGLAKPEGSARSLMLMIKTNPDAVREVIASVREWHPSDS